MTVKIRLKRMGAKKRPFYRVVVADARSPRDGRFIEAVGYYDPLKSPKVFHVDDERIRHWMATGARPSDAVRELLVRQGALPALPHPVRTKTGPKHAPKPGAAPRPRAGSQPVATDETAAGLGEGKEAADAPAPEAGEEIGGEADDRAAAAGPDQVAKETEPETAPGEPGAEDQADGAATLSEGGG